MWRSLSFVIFLIAYSLTFSCRLQFFVYNSNIPGMPTNCNAVRNELTKDLPEDANIQLWVGAWRYESRNVLPVFVALSMYLIAH